MWVWSLGQRDPLEEEMAAHSSMLAWKIPWTEESGRLQSVGSQRVRHDWACCSSIYPRLLSLKELSPLLWAKEELLLPDLELAAQVCAVSSPLSGICSLPASLYQVRLTPPGGCGFYDGLLILLLQLLTQVQLHPRIAWELRREKLGALGGHWPRGRKKPHSHLPSQTTSDGLRLGPSAPVQTL